MLKKTIKLIFRIWKPCRDSQKSETLFTDNKSETTNAIKVTQIHLLF
jgi:hypothetical protein